MYEITLHNTIGNIITAFFFHNAIFVINISYSLQVLISYGLRSSAIFSD